ncbi:MMPL family transporter [Methylocapsa sp. S129]|uniref:hopanoid transporter HpnN n=1 Tax=Methylocapsa sp. S129 TaxID=1641869 RepID=UPI00131C0B98|nr:MMPL family transporter [Methylocapsa sp. S129]
MIVATIARIVVFCGRNCWAVIGAFLPLACVSAFYLVQNFAITTDSSKLLSESLPWRQQEIVLDRAFPGRTDLIVAVVDAATPEAAAAAAGALSERLAPRTDLFHTVRQPGGEPFFAQEGLLFGTLAEVRRNCDEFLRAQFFLTGLAADPSLRGIMGVLSQGLQGVRLRQGRLEDFSQPIALIADALERSAAGRDPAFSWRRLIAGRAPEPADLRQFVYFQPKLDFGDLQPGGRAAKAIRDAAKALSLTPEHGVKVRLTGPVALSDEEFATVADGAAVNGVATALIVILILWLALKQPRLIVAVLANLVAGLAITAAVGLWMVGTLNLISVAFAVLFVGLGVDFGIQFTVRYRDARHSEANIGAALRNTGAGVSGPLLLAAASTAAGFYSFLPTAYRGLSELGLIAGTGMLIAFATSVTLLPALIAALKPKGEPDPIGFAALAPLDRFLTRWRFWIIGGTLGVTLLGAPLLFNLRFDFNPLNLRSASTESVSTLLDLMKDPHASPNSIDVLTPDLAKATALAAKLSQVPEVAETRTLQSFVPTEQPEKLAIIKDTASLLKDALNPPSVAPTPTDAEDIEALKATARDLLDSIGEAGGKTADDARRLSRLLTNLANGTPGARQIIRDALVKPLVVTLDQVRSLLNAAPASIESLPPSLVQDWVASDGRARIEVAPKGDSNDNKTMRQFADAVLKVAPEATGSPIFILEAAKTIVRAFWQAGLWSIVSIALLLFLVLRRLTDVALTLIPLMVAIVATLEICVLIDLPLNFANIIALPLLLGVGVAFKIYYVMAWRAGETNFLQLSLTRAVFFSALATATAFGSLWFSHHPGTSSMGKLMALALVTTLSAALLFQPALLATRKHD